MRTFLVIILAIVFLTGCSIIGPQERGVRIYAGNASDTILSPGPIFWIPIIAGVAKIDVSIQKSEVTTGAASKDMQEIQAVLAINWALDATKVVQTYKSIGDEDDVLEKIINPAVNEVLKAASAKRTAEEILSKRMELKDEIDDMLKKRLLTYNVTVHDISIVNIRFSEDFEKAIERKQIAEQEAKQAQYVAQKATADAQARINSAKGEAEAQVLMADSAARATIKKAGATAQAQKLIQSTITPEILQLKIIETWDGAQPYYYSCGNSSGALPLIQLPVPDLSKKKAAKNATTTSQDDAEPEEGKAE